MGIFKKFMKKVKKVFGKRSKAIKAEKCVEISPLATVQNLTTLSTVENQIEMETKAHPKSFIFTMTEPLKESANESRGVKKSSKTLKTAASVLKTSSYCLPSCMSDIGDIVYPEDIRRRVFGEYIPVKLSPVIDVELADDNIIEVSFESKAEASKVYDFITATSIEASVPVDSLLVTAPIAATAEPVQSAMKLFGLASIIELIYVVAPLLLIYIILNLLPLLSCPSTPFI